MAAAATAVVMTRSLSTPVTVRIRPFRRSGSRGARARARANTRIHNTHPHTSAQTRARTNARAHTHANTQAQPSVEQDTPGLSPEGRRAAHSGVPDGSLMREQGHLSVITGIIRY